MNDAVDMSPTEAESYNQGVRARDEDKNKSPPGGMCRRLRSWWLAGWNDRDIEREKSHERTIRG